MNFSIVMGDVFCSLEECFLKKNLFYSIVMLSYITLEAILQVGIYLKQCRSTVFFLCGLSFSGRLA